MSFFSLRLSTEKIFTINANKYEKMNHKQSLLLNIVASKEPKDQKYTK